MSKKAKHKPPQEQKNQGSISKGAAVIVILGFIGIMPLLVWGTLPESSPYTSVTTSSAMVQTAAYEAGLEICSSNIVTVNAPGATSAVLSDLSRNCGPSGSQPTAQVLTVGFSSTEAMNSAISSAMQTYNNKGGTNLQAFTSGYNVILLKGSPTDPAVQKMASSFIDQDATQIL